MWKGDDASKVAIHQWMYRQHGKPEKCELCGTTKAVVYDWANIDHKYKRKRKYWLRLCRGCHMKYDVQHNNWRGFEKDLEVRKIKRKLWVKNYNKNYVRK